MSADPIYYAVAILLAIGLSVGATALKEWQAPAVVTAQAPIAMAYVQRH